LANEIWHSADESFTLYALIWRQTDDRVYDAVAGSNTFDVYTDADIDDYDVVLTTQGIGADSDYHSVDFPTDIAAGIYRVQIMRQVGGTIDADADIAIAQGEIYWDGSAEQNFYTLIGADGDTLETLSDQIDDVIADTEEIIANTGKVVNVYPTGERVSISGGSTVGVEDEKD